MNTRPATPASEPVALADGEAAQSLIQGVAPIDPNARDLAALRKRRDARRGHAPLPDGGLFDTEAQRQQHL